MARNLIEIRNGAGGPSAYIGKTRIRVSDVVRMYQVLQEEMIRERIRESLPELSPGEIKAALDYWHAHRNEIDSEIADEDRLLESISAAD